jgi:hypothetical protein
MQKIFGVLLILLGVWVAIEVYTNGTDRAFGGLFAGHSRGQASVSESGPLTSRARDRVSGAYRTHEERTLNQVDSDNRPVER